MEYSSSLDLVYLAAFYMDVHVMHAILSYSLEWRHMFKLAEERFNMPEPPTGNCVKAVGPA
jgi:hypothetical protein